MDPSPSRPLQIRQTHMYGTLMSCLLALVAVLTVTEKLLGVVLPTWTVTPALLTVAVAPFLFRTGTTIDPGHRTATTWWGVLSLPIWYRHSIPIAPVGTIELSQTCRRVGRMTLAYFDIRVPRTDGSTLCVGGRRRVNDALAIAQRIGSLLALDVSSTIR